MLRVSLLFLFLIPRVFAQDVFIRNWDALFETLIIKNQLKYDFIENQSRLRSLQLKQLSDGRSISSNQKAGYGHHEENDYQVSTVYRSNQALVDLNFDANEEHEGSASFLLNIFSSQQKKIQSLKGIHQQEKILQDLQRDELLLQETRLALGYIIRTWKMENIRSVHVHAMQEADSLLRFLEPLISNGRISRSLLFSLETFSREQRLAVEQARTDVVVDQALFADFLQVVYHPDLVVTTDFIQRMDSLIVQQQNFSRVPYRFSIDSLNIEMQRKQYVYSSIPANHFYVGPTVLYDYTDDSYNVGVRAYFEYSFLPGASDAAFSSGKKKTPQTRNVIPDRLNSRFLDDSEAYLQTIDMQIREILNQAQLGYYQSIYQLSALLEKKRNMAVERFSRKASVYFDVLDLVYRLDDFGNF